MNFVLITWALCGGLFVYAFLANFRTMLLMPQYEKTIDSAQDILDRGMIPFVLYGGYYYRGFLLQSSNPTYKKLGEIAVVPKDRDQWLKMISEGIHGANTHVFLGFLCLSCYLYLYLYLYNLLN
jgi:apolipoprotein N-acyltransferase